MTQSFKIWYKFMYFPAIIQISQNKCKRKSVTLLQSKLVTIYYESTVYVHESEVHEFSK